MQYRISLYQYREMFDAVSTIYHIMKWSCSTDLSKTMVSSKSVCLQREMYNFETKLQNIISKRTLSYSGKIPAEWNPVYLFISITNQTSTKPTFRAVHQSRLLDIDLKYYKLNNSWHLPSELSNNNNIKINCLTFVIDFYLGIQKEAEIPERG